MKRSGWLAITRHQVVKEVVRKGEKACRVEDEGGRPIHRARLWQKYSRRLENEMMKGNWHKEEKGQISAPIILDLTAGERTTKLEEACRRFEAASGLHVTLRERASCHTQGVGFMSHSGRGLETQ